MKKTGLHLAITLFSALALLAPSSLAATAAEETGKTTLDRTIVPDGQKLKYGPGESRITRKLAWDIGGGKGRALGGLKQISDVHVIDEESPGRLEFFDNCGGEYKDSFRPQDALTTQVGNSMLQQLGAITTGPATGVPLEAMVTTGDNIDSNQFNELRWFIDLLDGETVTPNSGAETYDGYTQAETPTALTTEQLELAQQPFDSVGAQVPWYVVFGNHDALIRGQVAFNFSFNNLVIGSKKPFDPIETYDNCPGASGPTGPALAAFSGPYSRTVPADADRHFMTHDETVEELFNTTGAPTGHGLEAAPQDPRFGSRAGYYAWDIAPEIVGISMDTINWDGGSSGQLDDAQFNWIEEQLIASSKKYFGTNGKTVKNPEGTNKLVVLFSHHTSKTMTNPNADEPANGPYHCFKPTDAEGCDAEGLKSLLTRFPNVVAWVNGHEHNNRVKGFKGPKGSNPARAWWEISTAAHVDWPQQSRILEFAWKPGKSGKPDTFFIYSTTVDHAAAPVPDQAGQEVVDYLASLSRLESYRDACIREGQATCSKPGAPKDRNLKLVQKAPFNLGN
jgi:metallophosphoesterase (TIGR03767 family)